LLQICKFSPRKMVGPALRQRLREKETAMRLTIILVAPARAENVGAAARAMKTMGFRDLGSWTAKPTWRQRRWVAHGSGDILDGVTTYPPCRGAA
jgi:tRNA/rRNA methyltransferase